MFCHVMSCHVCHVTYVMSYYVIFLFQVEGAILICHVSFPSEGHYGFELYVRVISPEEAAATTTATNTTTTTTTTTTNTTTMTTVAPKSITGTTPDSKHK